MFERNERDGLKEVMEEQKSKRQTRLRRPGNNFGKGELLRMHQVSQTRAMGREPIPSAPVASESAFDLGLRTIPTKYRGMTWDNWEGSTFGLEEWKGDPWSVLVYGSVGVGKTHLATAVFRHLVRSAYSESSRPAWSFLWLDTTRLIRELQRAISESAESNLLHRASDVQLLLLDDLGAERPTEWATDQVSWLIRERHAWERPTIITSNLSRAAMEEWDGRVADRLHSEGRVIGLVGQSGRRIR